MASLGLATLGTTPVYVDDNFKLKFSTFHFRDDDKLELKLEFTKPLELTFHAKAEGRYVEKAFVDYADQTHDFEIHDDGKTWEYQWQKFEVESTKVCFRIIMSSSAGCKQSGITPYRGQYWPMLDFQIKVPSTGQVKNSYQVIDLFLS